MIPGQSPQDLILTPTGLLVGGRRLPCTIGKGGISRQKREGDGATPAGVHEIVGAFYRPDRLSRHHVPHWAEPLRLGDLWSDAPEAPDYNRHVRAPYPHSHEVLRRKDPLYDLVLVTDWNWPNAEPYKGSAIFLHSWRRPCFRTEGCVAFARRDLLWLAHQITPGARLVVTPRSAAPRA